MVCGTLKSVCPALYARNDISNGIYLFSVRFRSLGSDRIPLGLHACQCSLQNVSLNYLFRCIKPYCITHFKTRISDARTGFNRRIRRLRNDRKNIACDHHQFIRTFITHKEVSRDHIIIPLFSSRDTGRIIR